MMERLKEKLSDRRLHRLIKRECGNKGKCPQTCCICGGGWDIYLAKKREDYCWSCFKKKHPFKYKRYKDIREDD